MEVQDLVTAKNSQIMQIVTLLAAVCLLSVPAHAKYSGGTGEPNDPYQIATAEDLITLGESPDDYGKHFILTADIDLDPNLPGRKVFDKAVIAPDDINAKGGFQGSSFTGVFDGNGRTISHLMITGWEYLGLFGQFGPGGKVKNLSMLDVKISGSGFSGLGGLIGHNQGSVIQCYSSGIIIGDYNVGGLVGYNLGPVINCYSTCLVTGNYIVGGLVGFHWGSSITECYSTSVVTGLDNVGGLVGNNVGHIDKCYSTSAVTGNKAVGGLVGMNGLQGTMPYPGYIDKSYSLASVRGEISVGGLVGDNRVGHVMQCYSTGSAGGNESAGGLVGRSDWGGVLYSVWDVETSSLTRSAGGVGLTTREMMDPYMLGLNGFADDPNWVLNPGRDYPRLAWEGTPGQIIPEPDISWLAGRGTSEAPYMIDTSDQLLLLSRGSILWNKHFVLGADIDLGPDLPGRSILSQAPIQVFTGVFDGNSHVISRMTIAGASHLGLFGLLKPGAEIKDLGVVDVNITGSGVNIGGLIGYNEEGTVNRCYSSGTVNGKWWVGGLVGDNYGAVTKCSSATAVKGDSKVGGLMGSGWGDVKQCYSTGTVKGNSYVGGLIGSNYYGMVTQCYSTGTVSGSGRDIGGLVGYENNSIVTQCYSTGAVSGGDYVGGLVGYYGNGIVTQCYSAGTVSGGNYVGGLVGGGWSSDVTASFWDIQTSGQATSAGGEGKNTAEMKTAKTFLDAGWDFVGETANGTQDIWRIDEGKDYPRLMWQGQSN